MDHMSSWRYLAGSFASGLATLLALPLLCHPALVEAWARWHRDAARLLLSGAKAEPPGRERVSVIRALFFLPANIVTGLAIGLLLLIVVGNFALAAAATPFWWAFPASDRPRLFADVFIGDWATALTLGLLQLIVLGALAYLGFPIVARAQARMCVALLAPSREQRLAERVAELTRTRAGVLDAHGAELRRIERDLHDGTQARLVAIAMHLDLARKSLPAETPPLVDRLLREAHDNSEEAMTELRDVIRGIHPPILTDRGLSGALAALTARCPIPTSLHLDDSERVPAAVESVVYYAVAEALTNVTRHSRATEADVVIRRDGTHLQAEITDNGIGGARLPEHPPVPETDRDAAAAAAAGAAAGAGARGAARAVARARDRAWAWAGDTASSGDGDTAGRDAGTASGDTGTASRDTGTADGDAGTARTGAGETAGTGLAGIRDRVAALDGRLTVDSPVGGPTTIALEVPCG